MTALAPDASQASSQSPTHPAETSLRSWWRAWRSGSGEPPQQPLGPFTQHWWALPLSLVLVTMYTLFRWGPISNGGLINDIGIQYYFGLITLEGAVPIRDFDHGWNSGWWYFSALLVWLSGGNPNIWSLLYQGLLTGVLGFGLLAVALRMARLPTALVVFLPVVAAIIVYPAGPKYVIPLVWLAVLVAVWHRGRTVQLVTRVALASLTLLLQVELAVLLVAGTGLWDLVGARGVSLAERLARCTALVAGLALAVGAEIASYAAIGVSPATVSASVFLGQTETFPEFQFGWPLWSDPGNLQRALYPLLIILPFVPWLWRRAMPLTRLTASLALCLALIAIRRTDPAHVQSVYPLALIALVLVVWQLSQQLGEQYEQLRVRSLLRQVSGSTVVAGALGVVWVVGTIQIAFGWASKLAAAALMISCAAAAFLAITPLGRRRAVGAASLAAAAVLVALPLLGTAANVRNGLGATDSRDASRIIADAVSPEVDRCLGDVDEAFIMPNEMLLYERLSLENPTRYYLFHYGFVRFYDQIFPRMASGDIPALLVVGGFPQPPIREQAVEHYVRCSRVDVTETQTPIEIWVHDSIAPDGLRYLRVDPGNVAVELPLAEAPPPQRSAG